MLVGKNKFMRINGDSKKNYQVSGQSAVVNATLKEIQNFETTVLSSLSRPFNVLRDDVYGHFYRSQNTLRIARQNLFSIASKFPFFALSDETRQNLVKRLTAILINIIDPTVDYLQKDSMLSYFNFMVDPMTSIEAAVKQAEPKLQELRDAIKNVTDEACLKKVDINARKLTASLNPAIAAINDCTRNASALYRAPINEFTRVHFTALPFINRMSMDLSQCSNGNTKEACSVTFLTKYCEEDSCGVSSTM